MSDDDLINIYDHPTPIDTDGTLPNVLSSLEHVEGLDRVVVIVSATDATIEHRAEDRVRDIVADHPAVDAMVFGPAELGSLHRRLEQLEFSDMLHGVNLTGYGAVRNLGLMVAAVLGSDVALFLDDDQVVTDPKWLSTGLWGVGRKLEDGTPILAKTGYYTDAEGQYLRKDRGAWYDMFWRQRERLNQALDVISRPPRLQRSTIAFGGCLALHQDMFMNVSFDPWVVRGEDMDFVINARMHGADVFLDDDWHVVHQPPQAVSEALRWRQDVYRFVYEHRKIEFAKSQVDLRQVSAASMAPYPGEFIGSSVGWRAFLTGILRAVGRPEHSKYFQAALHASSDAGNYARENCQNYFEFQRRWPLMMETIYDDVALKSLFTGERRVDRSAITGRFPVVPSAE
ncbi:MAG: hypothetical protein HY876_05925 [Coriobacteriales bacterium]|nr:hypothetical protein [Coriobacteriales bacterium]